MARLKAFAANIWARATGNVESPDANLFDSGWQGGAGANPPTSRHENWWHQRVDESLADIERYGTMTWVAGGTYDIGTTARGSDGEIYESTVSGNTNNPTTLTGWFRVSKTGGYMPSGAVMPFAMSTAPAGWLKANGASVSRTTYAALFALIGTTYGAGDGSTTFNLPDLRGEFVRGWDDARGVDAARVLGSYQKGSIAAEDPTKDVAKVASLYNNQDDNIDGFWSRAGYDKITDSYPGVSLITVSGALDPLQTSEMGVTRPRNVALLYCIKY